MADNVID